MNLISQTQNHLNAIKVIILAIIIPAIFQACSSGNSEKKIDLIPVASGEKFGYVNREGNVVINPQFKQAFPFSFNRALVKTTGDKSSFVYIDETGKIAINGQFKSATSFSEGIAWTVKESGAPEAIDTEGKPLFKVLDADYVFNFSEGMARFSNQDKEGKKIYGYLNKEGKKIIQPQFYGAGNFKENLASVQNKEGLWGFINKDGKIVINYQFDDAFDFENEISVVKSGGSYGIIGLDGKYKLNPQFSEISIEPNGNLLIEQEGKYGWTDKEGKILINPQFDYASKFLNNNIAPVKATGDKYGYINKEGEFEINPQFDDATSFNNGIALVKSNGKFGFIDTKGNFIINPQFTEINSQTTLFFNGNYGNQSKETSVTAANEYIKSDYFDVSELVSEIEKNVSTKGIYGISTDVSAGETLKKYGIDGYDYFFADKTCGIPSLFAIELKQKAFNLLVGMQLSYDGFLLDIDSSSMARVNPREVLLQIKLNGNGKGKEQIVFDQLKNLISNYGEKYFDGLTEYKHPAFAIKNNDKLLILFTDNKDFITIYHCNFNENISINNYEYFKNLCAKRTNGGY